MINRKQRYQPQVIDRLTGEVIEFDIIIRREKGGKFMKLWQGAGWERQFAGLQGNSLKVLWHLVEIAQWGNKVPGPSLVARQVGKNQATISRAYRELREADFICQQDGVYYLSPFFCWKGNDIQLQQATREWLTNHSLPLQIQEHPAS